MAVGTPVSGPYRRARIHGVTEGWRIGPQLSDVLSHQVDRPLQLQVLLLEELVQAVEVRAPHVPVVVQRLGVRGVTVGEQARELGGDGALAADLGQGSGLDDHVVAPFVDGLVRFRVRSGWENAPGTVKRAATTGTSAR